MDLKLSSIDFSIVAEKLRPLLERVRENRFWIELAGLTLLAVAAAFALGSRALERTRALEARAVELEDVRAAVHRWSEQLHPPTPRESADWAESERALRSLGVESTQPLTLARVVSERAEEVGISNLRIRLASADSVSPPPPLEVGTWAIETGVAGLMVEFSGDIGDVISFLGALPPQVGVGGMTVRGEDGSLEVSAALLTRQMVPLE